MPVHAASDGGRDVVEIHKQQRRTVKHGELTIVAYRDPCLVQVGTDYHTPDIVRKLAAETPPGPGAAELIAKLQEQARWAEGENL